MPSDSRGFSMRVNTGKAITQLDCFPPKVRLHLMSISSFSPWHTHLYTHLTSCICIVFWEVHMESGVGGSSAPHISLNWMQVRDASLPAVKLWCGCPILGSMHLLVFTIIISKKVERMGWMEASGSAVHLQAFKPVACWRWMECPGQGFKVPRFPITHSRGMVLPDEWSLLKKRS